MIKCARHCPVCSPRQNPSATIPPNSICVHATTGINLPIQLCTTTIILLPDLPPFPPNTRPIHPFFSSRCNFNPAPIPTCTITISTNEFANCAWICGLRNCRPLCMWPMKYATVAIAVARICKGTCQRECVMPRTMPSGYRRPKARIMRRMCSHRIVSIGSGDMASPSGMRSWPPWADAGVRRHVVRRRVVRVRRGREGAMMAGVLCVFFARGVRR